MRKLTTTRRSVALGLSAALLLLGACGGDDDSGSSGTDAAPASSDPSGSDTTDAADGEFTVGIAACSYAIESARAQYEAIAYQLEQRGLNWSFQDAALDINAQVSQIDQFVAEGVDAIIVNLCGDPNAIAGPVARAQEAGIQIYGLGPLPVIEGVLVEASLPNELMGRLSAEYICDATGGEGEVAMMEAIDIPVLAVRWDTFAATLGEQCPNVEIVSRDKAIPDDAATARPIAEDVLTRFPDLAGYWAMGDGPALGVGLAVQAADKTIPVTGMNGESTAIDGINQGAVTVTWDMDPIYVGQTLADYVADILTGAAEVPTETIRFTTPDDMVIEYTADNVADWKPYEDRIPYPNLK